MYNKLMLCDNLDDEVTVNILYMQQIRIIHFSHKAEVLISDKLTNETKLR